MRGRSSHEQLPAGIGAASSIAEPSRRGDKPPDSQEPSRHTTTSAAQLRRRTPAGYPLLQR